MSYFKITTLTLGLLTTLGLAACQNQPPAKEHKPHTAAMQQDIPEKMDKFMRKEHQHRDWHKKKDFEQRGWQKLTAEQRADIQKKMQQRHAERQVRFETLQKACEGKAGQKISVKLADQTIDGQCETHFRPTRNEKK